MLVVSTARRKAVPIDDDDYLPPVAGRNALRYSHAALDDNEDLHFRSRRQDEKLLGDITSKLNTMEMDNVKPSYGIRQKAGFRKYINNNGPRVSKRELFEYKKRKEGNAGYKGRAFDDEEDFKPDLSQLNYLQLEDEYKCKARAIAKSKVARCKKPSMSERIAYKASMMGRGVYSFSDDPPLAAEALLGSKAVRGRQDGDNMSNISHLLSQLKSIEDDSTKRRERLRDELDLEAPPAPSPRRRPQQPTYDDEDDYEYTPVQPRSRSQRGTTRVVYGDDDEEYEYRPVVPASRRQVQQVSYEDEEDDYKPIVPASRQSRRVEQHRSYEVDSDGDEPIYVDRSRSIKLDRIEQDVSKTLSEQPSDLFGKYINDWVLSRRPMRKDDDIPTISVRTRDPPRARAQEATVEVFNRREREEEDDFGNVEDEDQAAKRNAPSPRPSASSTARLAREELADYEDLIQSRPYRSSVRSSVPVYSYEYEHIPVPISTPAPRVVKTGNWKDRVSKHIRIRKESRSHSVDRINSRCENARRRAQMMIDLQPYKTSSTYANDPTPAFTGKNYTREDADVDSAHIMYQTTKVKPEAKMSDARRHAREVLCRQKRDPHYFE